MNHEGSSWIWGGLRVQGFCCKVQGSGLRVEEADTPQLRDMYGSPRVYILRGGYIGGFIGDYYRAY